MYTNILPTTTDAAAACQSAPGGTPTKILDTIAWFHNANSVWNEEEFADLLAEVRDAAAFIYDDLASEIKRETGVDRYPYETAKFNDITAEDLPRFISGVLGYYGDEPQVDTKPAGPAGKLMGNRDATIAEHLLTVLRLSNASTTRGVPEQTDGVFGYAYEAMIRLLRTAQWPRAMTAEAIIHAIEEDCTMREALLACQTGR
ncbi:hypothetical protein [Streptosporangium sp. NPDC001681]|uniref:hypothetical protein n=1 Tax=Streptosporangium sp. NPDC001681 TaxID=3154395 RepID=UPI0033288BDD